MTTKMLSEQVVVPVMDVRVRVVLAMVANGNRVATKDVLVDIIHQTINVLRLRKEVSKQ